jgi:hypothetical protein
MCTGARKLGIPHLKGVIGRFSFLYQRAGQPRHVLTSKLFVLIVLIAGSLLRPVFAETIPVRQMEGSLHGFLVLQTLDGKTIAEGDLIETARAAAVKVQMIFRFHDGSYYEESSEFSQRGQFRLLRNHLVQKGPSFKLAMERSIDASTGQVSVRYTDEKGNQKEESEHIELPADLANGMFLILLKNINPGTSETTVSVLAGEPKPRLIKVIIAPQGKTPFTVGRSKREAIDYDLKPKIEGAAGVVAPLLGKQPADAHIWVVAGEGPIAIKSEGPLQPEGPVWRIVNVGAVWPSDAAQTESKKQ